VLVSQPTQKFARLPFFYYSLQGIKSMALGVFQQHNVQTKFRTNRSTGSKADMWDMQVQREREREERQGDLINRFLFLLWTYYANSDPHQLLTSFQLTYLLNRQAIPNQMEVTISMEQSLSYEAKRLSAS
jgi:hypothetical protein